MSAFMDLEEQYEKIYRYCYSKVHQREMAEDITQEVFLRFFESNSYTNTGKSLHYLYTIARNLCIDEHRKRKNLPVENESAENDADDNLATRISVRMALSELDETDRELLLLRYANEVPVSTISKLLGISRFSVYRKLLQATKKFKAKLGEGDFV